MSTESPNTVSPTIISPTESPPTTKPVMKARLSTLSAALEQIGTPRMSRVAKEEARESKKIDDYLQQEKKKFERLLTEPRILILGSSDAGKTTLLKQLKIMYGNGFTDEEKQEAKLKIWKSIANCCQVLLEELTSFEKYVSIYDFVSDYHDKVYPTELIPLIQDMWQEEESQKMFKKLQDAEIPLSMRMYFSDIHRILESNYVPTNQDILHLRISTNSVTETIFQIDGNAFHFYDVSGLKHRRRQWTQYFMDVTTILFIVSLAGYDQVMAEDEKTNRLTDSIVLFGQIVNNPILSKPDVIVFFNKQDLYDEKIKQSNLHDYFPEYVGKKGSKSQGYHFIKEKFLSQSQDEKRLILTHTTCCTDAGVMSKIIYSVMYSHFLNVVLALFKKIYQMLD